MLELKIERLNKEASGAKCWCPYSSSSCPWGRSPERCVWSPNPHRAKETHNLFWAWGGDILWWEAPKRTPKALNQRRGGGRQPRPTAHPKARVGAFLPMPMTGCGTRGRWGCLSEPSIKNYELWLEWWACQLDTPHWWEELTTIPEVGDIKKLAWKICASFNVLAVWYKALRSQGYTALLRPSALRGVCFSPMTHPTKTSGWSPSGCPLPMHRCFNTGCRKPICQHPVSLTL